jgi:hypothetical protein
MTLIELAGRFDFGSWPEPEPAFIAGIGVESSPWRLLTHAGLGKRLVLPNPHGGQIELVPVTVSIEPGFRFARRRWGFETCVGAELGITHSHSNQLEPRDHDALSLAILVLPRGTWDLGAKMRGWIGLGAAIPVIRPRWISVDGDLYHAFGPAIRSELGLQIRF